MSEFELHYGADRAVVALEGAHMLRWSVGGREMLWQIDAQFWDRAAPILFPLCGWTRDGVRVKGQHYPLGLHGFAHRKHFSCVQHSENFLRLRLSDDEDSRALYPFSFIFEVSYQLSAGRLDVQLDVLNTSDEIMPYACGLHPGFALARPHEAHLVFLGPRASDISADVPVITANGLFSADRYPIPLAKNVLPLDRALWPQDALCFLDLPVDRLRLDYGDGQLHLHTHNFPHCVLWSRPQAPFIALESWTGYGDPWDFEGELFAKPSMILLPAGGRGQHIASYRFTAG